RIETVAAVCGNGILDLGEDCDDGNTISGDGCDFMCLVEYCGNGIIEALEQCDDGNFTNGDGCDSTCRIEIAAAVCGDGTIDLGEDCDDGNTISGDGCSSTCNTGGSISAECVNAATGFTCAGAASNTQPVIDSCVSNARIVCSAHPGGIFYDFPGTFSYSGFFPNCTAEQTVWYTCDW
ncbi:MAG: DUF4215 domain-containing protein, partial [bacterium]|nr:DUF4215 domain-containing protein [bacterium]